MHSNARQPTRLALSILGVLIVAIVTARTTHARDLTLSGVTSPGDLPTIVADARGLFRGTGADLTVAFRLSGRRNLAALRTGDIEFAVMALTPLVLDRLRDRPPGRDDDPVILAKLAHGIDLNHVVVLNGAGKPPAKALRGKRIGITRGTNARFMWSLFRAFHGVEATSVPIVDLPIDAIPDALAAGRIDGAVVWQPWTDRLKHRFGDRLRVFPARRIYAASWVLVARRATIAESPELCRTVLRAYHRAVHWIKANPAAAAAIYRRRADLANGSGEALAQRLVYDLSLDWSVVSGLLQQANWAARNGDGTRPLAPLDLMAPGPLRAVRPGHVHLPDGKAASHRGDTGP